VQVDRRIDGDVTGRTALQTSQDSTRAIGRDVRGLLRSAAEDARDAEDSELMLRRATRVGPDGERMRPRDAQRGEPDSVCDSLIRRKIPRAAGEGRCDASLSRRYRTTA